MNRRRFVGKGLAVAGAIAAATVVSRIAAEAALQLDEKRRPVPGGDVVAAVQGRAKAFNLADVRLIAGPSCLFQQAMDRDARYLLALDPNRLLNGFHVNAGLTPKAAAYGGWESSPVWTDLRCQGHTLGHYLSACSLMYAATGDIRFKQRADDIVTELAACQTAGRKIGMGGLVCAFPDGKAQFDNIAAAAPIVGVPWYTMHKVFAGLRDANIHCGSPLALDVLVGLSDWAEEATHKLSGAEFQAMLGTEHGGMNEVLADVYALTGDPQYLALAKRFCHHAVLDPLTQKVDALDHLHSNTQIPKVIGLARLYEVTGFDDYATASQFFWDTVVGHRTFATGGNGDGEHFFAPTAFPAHLKSAKTMETCCTYNMLKLTRQLYQQTPTSNYADYYERALYNDILASQDPVSGMMTYFQGTRPGYLKLYCTPTESFWCCTGSGMENHAKYADSIYFHSANALFVNLFIPSVLTWKAKGMTITQETRFPEEDATHLRFRARYSTRLALNIRQPYWCAGGVGVTVNGAPVASKLTPDGYVQIDREWHDGDTVEIKLPMAIHTEALPGAPKTVAILYGPIVLAGALGAEGITPGSDLIVSERDYGKLFPEPITVPTLAVDPKRIAEHIEPVSGAPLTFRTVGIGRPAEVTLIPYYRIAHQRYNLYWSTPA